VIFKLSFLCNKVAWKGADVGEEESAIKKTKKCCMCVNCYAYILVVNHGEHLKIPKFSPYLWDIFPILYL
jgi:hypothetical protein